jgi:hypothetical protein
MITIGKKKQIVKPVESLISIVTKPVSKSPEVEIVEI